MKKISALLVLTALTSVAIADDNITIYNWKTAKGSNAYSDIPNNLKISGSNIVNVRTGTVTPPAVEERRIPANAMEAQQMANEMIAAENKRAQEAHAKQVQETREENCKAARMNRANVENARNKDELIPRFDAEIAKYCNS